MQKSTLSGLRTWEDFVVYLANLHRSADLSPDEVAAIVEAHDRIWMAPPEDLRAFSISEDGMTTRLYPAGTTLREVRREYPHAKALPKSWRPQNTIEMMQKMAEVVPHAEIDVSGHLASHVDEWRKLVNDTVVTWLRLGFANLPSVTVVRSEGEGVHRRPVLSTQGPPLVMALHRALTGKRVPFGLCPVCDRVFHRVKRQVYCSPGCAERSNKNERQAKRREYMRTYMGERRRRARLGADSAKEK